MREEKRSQRKLNRRKLLKYAGSASLVTLLGLTSTSKGTRADLDEILKTLSRVPEWILDELPKKLKDIVERDRIDEFINDPKGVLLDYGIDLGPKFQVIALDLRKGEYEDELGRLNYSPLPEEIEAIEEASVGFVYEHLVGAILRTIVK